MEKYILDKLVVNIFLCVMVKMEKDYRPLAQLVRATL